MTNAKRAAILVLTLALALSIAACSGDPTKAPATSIPATSIPAATAQATPVPDATDPIVPTQVTGSRMPAETQANPENTPAITPENTPEPIHEQPAETTPAEDQAPTLTPERQDYRAILNNSGLQEIISRLSQDDQDCLAEEFTVVGNWLALMDPTYEPTPEEKEILNCLSGEAFTQIFLIPDLEIASLLDGETKNCLIDSPAGDILKAGKTAVTEPDEETGLRASFATYISTLATINNCLNEEEWARVGITEPEERVVLTCIAGEITPEEMIQTITQMEGEKLEEFERTVEECFPGEKGVVHDEESGAQP